MRRSLLLLVLLGLLGGCNSAPPASSSQGSDKSEELKSVMTTAFTGLELYAADHSDSYPEKLEELVPKYLDELPHDPADNQPLVYQKTETGFLLSASAEYNNAEKGFPQMDNFGFFAMKSADFPSPDSEDL